MTKYICPCGKEMFQLYLIAYDPDIGGYYPSRWHGCSCGNIYNNSKQTVVKDEDT